jgi:site-specific recombinase XerC
MREAVKDKSYRAYEIGQEAGAYLRWKRGRITPDTYRDYEACLDKLARAFPDLTIKDFEPPVGTERLEEFLANQWGERAPRTYNKNLSIAKDFFKWAVLKGRLHGDPSLPLIPHKKRDVHRETFSEDLRGGILAGGPHPDHLRRDRLALRLLLKYGLRKGALQHIQFKHFDQSRRRLTIFTKGEKVRELPIVDLDFWGDLAKLILEIEAEPHHYLMPRHKTQMSFRGYDRKTGAAINERRELTFPEKPMGAHGLHNWWYACLERAGVTAKGQTSGERMHKARHTAGQNVLDKTGNLKAVQKLLGHASIQTTADIYTDWDIDQLAETLRGIE